MNIRRPYRVAFIVAFIGLAIAGLFFGYPSLLYRDTTYSYQEENPQLAFPEILTSATNTLFEQGLGDPRGCEYREVEIKARNVWGEERTIQVHGFVQPVSNENQPSQQVVCWDGLIYSAVSVGKKVDLKHDIEHIGKVNRFLSETNWDGIEECSFHKITQAFEISHRTCSTLKVCLLLRLGEVDLARRAWEISLTPRRLSNLKPPDPYLELARTWAYSLYDRGLCAHMVGDDQTALERFQMLARVNRLIEAEAERRGFQRPEAPPKVHLQTPMPYLHFVWNLSELLADQERRARAQITDTTFSQTEPQVSENNPAPIATLIKNLDQVNARQWGQPGGVNLADDPIVQALIARGEEAVPLLLDTFAFDNRLTRSVHFHRDFMPDRAVLRVHEAAYTALTAILQTSFFSPNRSSDNLSRRSQEQRQEIVRQMRDYWTKYHGIPLVERWYQVLMDPTIEDTQWLIAASKIVKPAGEKSYIPGSMIGTATPGEGCQPNQPQGLCGDPLRSKVNPTITELMSQRAIDLAGNTLNMTPRSIDRGSDMAMMLVRWDPSASLPVLQSLANHCRDLRAKTPRTGPACSDRLSRTYYLLLKTRVQLGDTTATSELAELEKEGPFPDSDGQWILDAP
ncbi:MAG: hypothetical protein HY774_07660 [Acidobacteria bacterium]|nr:hypothetical protein [Acidobacteriota bacterium]